MNEDLNMFVSKFFTNLGANFVNNGNMINVSNVPIEVQDFLGKNEPFVFAFDEQTLIENPEAELVSRGSTIIKLMNEYMQRKGQTTLIKIDFSKEAENIIIPAVLREGEIYKQEKKEVIEHLSRFTFLTDFQYLNEKEKIINEIFVKDGEIIDFDLGKYKTVEGNLNEVNTKEVKDNYTIAKNFIKSKLKPKIEDLSTQLEAKLEKELERINTHYTSQDDEIKAQIEKLSLQLAEAEKEDERKKIIKINEEIAEKKVKLTDKMREVEKNFFINDETNKHSLNLNTTLINATIIYYNNFNFKLYLRNGKVIRSIELDFDPFNNKLSNIVCDSCKWPLKELYLCSSGHVSCEKCCVSKCAECKMSICKTCTKKECHVCSKTLCRRCDGQCAVCFKTSCKDHSKLDSLSARIICTGCGRECCKCGKWFDNKKLKVFGPKKICEACFRLNSIGK